MAFGERVVEIIKSVADFRLIEPGFDGATELRRMITIQLVRPKKEPVRLVTDEPNTQGRRDAAYLMHESDTY